MGYPWAIAEQRRAKKRDNPTPQAKGFNLEQNEYIVTRRSHVQYSKIKSLASGVCIACIRRITCGCFNCMRISISLLASSLGPAAGSVCSMCFTTANSLQASLHPFFHITGNTLPCIPHLNFLPTN